MNKYLYGILSSIRARQINLAHLLLDNHNRYSEYLSTLLNKKSLLIISILAIFQLIDLAPGISNYYFGKQYKNQNQENVDISNRIKGLSKQFNLLDFLNQIIILVYFFIKRTYLNENYEKTMFLIWQELIDKKLLIKNIKIIEQLNNKSLDLFNKTLFVSDDYNFVRNVYFLSKIN